MPSAAHPHEAFDRAVSLFKSGRPIEALSACDESLATHPDCAQCLGMRGMILRQLGRPVEAIEALQQADARKPAPWLAVGVLSTLGLTLQDLGRFDEALEAFRRSTEIDPKQMCDWYNRATLLLNLRRTKEALTCFEHAVANDPSYADGWVNLGIVQHQLGRDEEAGASFDRALALDANHARALLNKAILLGRLGQPMEAVPLLRRLTELTPDDLEAWATLARICLSVRERYFEVHEVALRAVDRALAIEPTRGELWVMKADGLRRGWHLGSVLEKLEPGVAADLRADPPSRDALARTALACLDRAAELWPLFAPTWALRAEVLSDLGDDAGALLARARFAELAG